MKKFFAFVFLCSLAFSTVAAARVDDLAAYRKKKGADELASRTKNANSVAALRQVVLELIELETGGK